ncbi:calcium transporter [Histoplasma capsulatum]|uniref:Calcium transporter n=1 Tax=Ajellomyces capsulatus TaxID=5037 RepID=A0A8A1LWJ1_AJECA|nr:calcium transporter [Histoplasma capsulatum]
MPVPSNSSASPGTGTSSSSSSASHQHQQLQLQEQSFSQPPQTAPGSTPTADPASDTTGQLGRSQLSKEEAERLFEERMEEDSGLEANQEQDINHHQPGFSQLVCLPFFPRDLFLEDETTATLATLELFRNPAIFTERFSCATLTKFHVGPKNQSIVLASSIS